MNKDKPDLEKLVAWDFVRFMLHRDYYDLKSLNWFFRLMRAIPVSAKNRRDIVESLKHHRWDGAASTREGLDLLQRP